MTAKKQIVKVDDTKSIQNALIEIVQRKDIDPDRLEKFLDLQIKLEERQNEKAFNQAMSMFQGKCPIITKKKKVSFKTTNYSYAPIDEIVFEIKPLLTEFGLSFSFNVREKNETISYLDTIITHIDGHSKVFTIEFEHLVNDSTSMNSSQRRKSALSYAKRAGLENALGIVTQGEDDDANRLMDVSITPQEIQTIKGLMKATDTTKDRFLQFLKVQKLEELDSFGAKKAINALKQKRAANA
ncbi:MAG: putative essential recombination function protein [Prokaryotic dsDNA virus sp.]|nr:MAG: putative essential recombination function protein [Prokaryotic dsDNA virus sp.]|tara:strand:- start:2353 stop:3075 length:723 start_codon:yes stop_codon:yes gene_type:complete